MWLKCTTLTWTDKSWKLHCVIILVGNSGALKVGNNCLFRQIQIKRWTQLGISNMSPFENVFFPITWFPFPVNISSMLAHHITRYIWLFSGSRNSDLHSLKQIKYPWDEGENAVCCPLHNYRLVQHSSTSQHKQPACRRIQAEANSCRKPWDLQHTTRIMHLINWQLRIDTNAHFYTH